jgi:hypothetical protein
MGGFEYRIVRDLLWSLRRTHHVGTVSELADAMGVQASCAADLARTMCGWTHGLSPPEVELALLEELGSSVRLLAVRLG